MSELLQPYDYVLRNSKERPDDLALVSADQQFTWRALFEMTKRMARELRDRGVQPGDVIGVRLPPMLANLSILTIWHEAAIYLPFVSTLVDADFLDVRLVISREPIEGWPAEKTLILDNDWFEKIHMNSTIIEQNRYPSDDAFCRYALSSGTTGRPKVMRIPLDTTLARAQFTWLGHPEHNQILTMIGTRNEAGINSLLAALFSGKPYLVPLNGANNASLIQRFEVDILRGSPAQMAELVTELESTGQKIPTVKWVVPGGTQMPEVLGKKIVALSGAILGNGYGATEVGSIARRFESATDNRFMGPVVEGTEVQIVDDNTNEPVADGESGLIRIRRAYMLTEYFNDPEATAKHFRDGYFYPGDRGYLTPEGLYLDGRDNEIINSGGVKTDPALVDDAFAKVSGLTDWAAFGLPDKNGVTRIALAYVADRDINPQKLYDEGFALLGVRTPRSYHRVSAIPRTEMGKARRADLTERFTSSVGVTTRTAPEIVLRDEPTDGEFIQPFEHLRRAWKAAPEAPAIINISSNVSRRSLYFGAKQFGILLRERGVVPGDIVALNVPTALSLRFSFGVFHEAAVLAPFIPAMVKPNPWGVKWLVTSERIDAFPAENQILVDTHLMNELRNMPHDLEPREYPSADSLLRLAFSSGTTGVPKAIPFTVAQTEARALDHESRTMSASQSMCLMTPRLGMGWWSWYASVLVRRPYLQPGTPLENLRLLRRLRVDSIMASPAQLADIIALLRQSGTTLPDIKIIQSGGSLLPLQMFDAIKELTNATVMNAYGTTEVGPTTLRTNDESDPTLMGELLPGTEAEIVDPETDQPLPEGKVGLLRVRRHTMVDGYFNNEEATSKAWRDGWFYSGDFAHLKGNQLYMDGRDSEIVNVGGVKIDPAVIDAHFARYPTMKDVAAFGIFDDMGMEKFALAFVSDDDIDVEQVKAEAFAELKALTPMVFIRVDTIPRNEMGKILRTTLRDDYLARQAPGTEER